MNSWFPALIAAIIAVLSQMVVAAYVYGKLTQRVSTTESRLESLHVEQKEQRGLVANHGERIASLETGRRLSS